MGLTNFSFKKKSKIILHQNYEVNCQRVWIPLYISVSKVLLSKGEEKRTLEKFLRFFLTLF